MSCLGNLMFMGLADALLWPGHKVLGAGVLCGCRGSPDTQLASVGVAGSWKETGCTSRFRLEEPWDSPHNRALAGGLGFGMGGVHPLYHCPSESPSDNLDATYVTFVGDKAFSPGARPRTFKEITDGLSNTIWLGEMADSRNPLDGAAGPPVRRDELQDRRPRASEHPQRIAGAPMYRSSTAA